MDTSDPEIRFDENGQCNHCTSALERLQRDYLPDARGEAKLQALIAQMEEGGKDKAYNCIIGLSGGVDSSYLAFKSKEWGLRPLLFHVDGGWNTDAAQANVKNLAAWLGYDLQVYTVDWAEMQDMQIAYLKSAVANQDVPQDHLFFAVLYKKAEELGIGWWLSGVNLVSESILPKAWGYSALDGRQLRAIHRRFGSRPLRTFLTLSFYDYCKFFGYLPFFAPVKTLTPLNLMPYSPDVAKKAMEEAFNWQNYGRKHDESRFTRFFQNYYLPVKFGFEKRRAHLASLIVSGQISRDGALKEMEKELYKAEELAEDIEFIRESLELSNVDWNSLMALPNRRHAEYPSYEMLFTLGRRVKRLLLKPASIG